MNNKYVELFDILIKSYYNGNFDETLNKIITCHEKSPQETFAIITSLCGVDIKFDNNYVYNLKKAITEYNVKSLNVLIVIVNLIKIILIAAKDLVLFMQ